MYPTKMKSLQNVYSSCWPCPIYMRNDPLPKKRHTVACLPTCASLFQ